MKTYQLKPAPEPDTGDLLPGLPRQLDDGRRVLKVYRPASVAFIRASAERRGVWSHAQLVADAWEITLQCDKPQFEAIREEFNGRHRA